MQRIPIIVFLILLTSSLPVAATAWDDHTRAGEYAFAIGQFDRAETEFKNALRIAQGFSEGDRRLETSLSNLARFYEHRSDYDHAQPMYQLLLAAQEARLGRDHGALLPTLAGIARVCLAEGDVPTAVESLRRYVSIADSLKSTDTAELAQVLGLLSRSLALQDESEEALDLQRRAVRLMVEDDTLSDLAIANAMESLAQLELRHGDPARARELLVSSFERRRRAEEFVDPSIAFASAAATAYSSGNMDVAENLAMTALESEGQGHDLAEDVLVDVAWFRVRRSSENLADLFGVAKQDPLAGEAAQRLESQLERLEADPSADPAALAKTRKRLMTTRIMLGDAERALAMQRASIEDAPSTQQRIAARTTLVDLLSASGMIAEAVEANAALIVDVESQSGEVSPDLIGPLSQQQDLLTEKGEKRAAKKIKKRLKKLHKALRKRGR